MWEWLLYCTFINHQHEQERGRTDAGDTGNQQTGDRRCWKFSDARLTETRGQKATEKADKVVTCLRPVRRLMPELRREDLQTFRKYIRVPPTSMMNSVWGYSLNCRKNSPTGGNPLGLVSGWHSSSLFGNWWLLPLHLHCLWPPGALQDHLGHCGSSVWCHCGRIHGGGPRHTHAATPMGRGISQTSVWHFPSWVALYMSQLLVNIRTSSCRDLAWSNRSAHFCTKNRLPTPWCLLVPYQQSRRGLYVCSVHLSVSP